MAEAEARLPQTLVPHATSAVLPSGASEPVPDGRRSFPAAIDALAFLRAWIADPIRVASVTPSSSDLADLITREVDPSSGPVLELGPGTGVFTRALLKRGVREQDLVLVEYGSDFARLLAQRHPAAQVLWMDATRIADHEEAFLGRRFGAVVSGLPVLSMSARKQFAIMSGCFSLMEEGAALYQFTYAPVCPIPRVLLERLGLKARKVGSTLKNLPPASVYRITRRPRLIVRSSGDPV